MKRKERRPSEQPIHRDDYRRLPIARLISNEPLTPGLRRDRQKTEVIGFTANLSRDDLDD